MSKKKIIGIVIGLIILLLVAYSVSNAPPSSINAKLGEEFKVGSWAITVTKVESPQYIIDEMNVLYRAQDGSKIVVITIKITNLSDKTQTLNIRDIVLVTDSKKSYEPTIGSDLVVVQFLPGNISIEGAKHVVFLQPFESVASNAYIIRNMIFQVSQNEKPIRLDFKVGYTDVHISLATS